MVPPDAFDDVNDGAIRVVRDVESSSLLWVSGVRWIRLVSINLCASLLEFSCELVEMVGAPSDQRHSVPLLCEDSTVRSLGSRRLMSSLRRLTLLQLQYLLSTLESGKLPKGMKCIPPVPLPMPAITITGRTDIMQMFGRLRLVLQRCLQATIRRPCLYISTSTHPVNCVCKAQSLSIAEEDYSAAYKEPYSLRGH